MEVPKNTENKGSISWVRIGKWIKEKIEGKSLHQKLPRGIIVLIEPMNKLNAYLSKQTLHKNPANLEPRRNKGLNMIFIPQIHSDLWSEQGGNL